MKKFLFLFFSINIYASSEDYFTNLQTNFSYDDFNSVSLEFPLVNTANPEHEAITNPFYHPPEEEEWKSNPKLSITTNTNKNFKGVREIEGIVQNTTLLNFLDSQNTNPDVKKHRSKQIRNDIAPKYPPPFVCVACQYFSTRKDVILKHSQNHKHRKKYEKFSVEYKLSPEDKDIVILQKAL